MGSSDSGEYYMDEVYSKREIEKIQNKVSLDKIEKYFKTKQEFARYANMSIEIKSIMIRILVDGEIYSNKDCIYFSINEIREMTKRIANNKFFTSRRILNNYYLVLSNYTKWACLEKGYRKEYYTTKELKREIGTDELITNNTQNILTPYEMKQLFNQVNNLSVKIVLFAALEGIKSEEILGVTIEQIKKMKDSRFLTLSNRSIEISDDLYQMMLQYAMTTSKEKGFRNGSKVSVLENTPYLIRAFDTQKSKYTRMGQSTFNDSIKKELQKVGYKGKLSYIRNCCKVYDLLKGMSMDAFNIKYGLKVKHKSMVYSENKIIEKYLEEKIKEENLVQVLNINQSHQDNIVEEVEHKDLSPPTTLEVLNEKFKKEIQKSSMLSHESRMIKIGELPGLPSKTVVTTMVYERNPHIVVEVLNRANGICENCNKLAPFIRESDGTPYLEVHHIIRLADGGEDSLENTIAVCPNCHRELHYGVK